ncbi:MAG: hypothetical protein V3U78_04590 [Thiotrichaceae bacterium]
MQNIIHTEIDGAFKGSVVISALKLPAEDCLKLLPKGVHCEVVEDSLLPKDRLFRNCWKHDTSSSPEKISIDIDGARETAHQIRRMNRQFEYKPHDNIIAKDIPGADKNAAYTSRDEIRIKDDQLQIDIEAGSSADAFKQTLIDNQQIIENRVLDDNGELKSISYFYGKSPNVMVGVEPKQ